MEEAEFSHLLADLLAESHRLGPGDLPGTVRTAARAVGMTDAVIFLSDLQQIRLVPVPDGVHHGQGTEQQGPAETGVAVDGSLAGWAYRTGTVQLSSGSDLVLWLPLVDGVERLGVLRLTASALESATLEQCKSLASLTGQLIAAKSRFGDLVSRLTRSKPMLLQAELAWAFMPPRTIGCPEATSSAILEPAYEIGGDAFDHTLTPTALHMAVIDAMGHDLASGLCAAVAMAGSRSTRRSGGDLADIPSTVDAALHRWLPDRLLTGVFADLALATGALTWVNCGHPPPMIIRRQHVVHGALERPVQLPLGLPTDPEDRRPRAVVHHAQLEPGDRLLIHTDGVTEARSSTGDLFGESRLIDSIIRATAAGEPAPEALRRLVRAILAHHNGHLADDATILLAEWHPVLEAGR
ncbi:PP2C family protein-serine/threonine phosphatase [Streptomyces sp. NPDC046876]|uniref:PP2C family protein-serine/threonine phosphatase n=1 Tax=Streptomyces sp. NPDC046876 TaxID=3155616 RepID=UPI0033E2A4AE